MMVSLILVISQGWSTLLVTGGADHVQILLKQSRGGSYGEIGLRRTTAGLLSTADK